VTSKCTRRFWKLHDALPAHVQSRAKKSYELWKIDNHHPSLDFKKLKGGNGIGSPSAWAITIVPSGTWLATLSNGCGSAATKSTIS